jgi:hypothetical protein
MLRKGNDTMSIYSGRPFKVISATNDALLAEFDQLDEAQAYADQAHRDDATAHFRVVQIKWCGGSMRLSDLKHTTG